jgi:formylglycine-generating enzyme required for sulfatase activity
MSSVTWLRAAAASALAALCLTAVTADVPDEDVDPTLRHGLKGFTNSLGMKMLPIPRGKFLMGSTDEERKGQEDFLKVEGPRHQVELTRDFYLAAHEVTQKQYKQVMGKNPASFSAAGSRSASVKGMDTDDFPVEMVSWYDAQEFIAKLNARAAEKQFAVVYRLPTEAEWEYACRAGTDEPFDVGKPSKSLSSTQANFNGAEPFGGAARGPSLGRTCKVGSYRPNAWGLYDMHGNVFEWCADWLDEKAYVAQGRRDPTGPAKGTWRVMRGGSWIVRGVFCRAAFRGRFSAQDAMTTVPERKREHLGFRVAASPRAR